MSGEQQPPEKSAVDAFELQNPVAPRKRSCAETQKDLWPLVARNGI